MTQAVRELETLPPLATLLQREFAENELGQRFGVGPEILERLWNTALGAPLTAIAARGGKEFRGQLVSIAWQMAGGRGEVPIELTGAIEALHLGSLIVDDIEDGSIHRRGAPTLHQSIGLPVALNAGNWLYFWPTVLIDRLELEPSAELELRRTVDRAVLDCHYGQALDLTVRINQLRQREVRPVVLATTSLKTGSLMELAARIGAITAGGNAKVVNALGALGRELGIALQMCDDLSGVCDERRRHKGREDLLDARPTWLWAWLAETLEPIAYCRLRALGESVASRDVAADILAEELRDAVCSTGQADVRARLTSALAALELTLREPRGQSALKQWILRLLSFHG